MSKENKKVINKFEYTFNKIPARKSLKMVLTIFNSFISPMLRGLNANSLSDLDPSTLKENALTLMSNLYLDEKDVEDLVTELLGAAMVKDSILTPERVDVHFTNDADLVDMFEVAYEVAIYNGFFELLTKVQGKFKNKTEQPKELQTA